MRAIAALFALSALFTTGCVIDVDDADHHWNEPIDAVAEFTWEFLPGLSCWAADVSTVTVVLDDRYVVEEFTDSCHAGSMIIEGLPPGTYRVEAFGDPSGWYAAYNVTLYGGYNLVNLQLR